MTHSIEQEKAFDQKLGRALSAWSAVEQQTYILYAHYMKGANKHLISITFFHIQSFESKITLLDRCSYYTLNDEQKSGWKKLKKRLGDYSNIRNRLAHHPTIISVKNGQTRIYKGPSHFDATAVVKGHAGKEDREIDGAGLDKAAFEFKRLSSDLRSFRERLS